MILICEIVKKIKYILDTEMIPSGRIKNLKKVYIGDYQALPAASYPAAMVKLSGMSIEGDSGRRDVRADLTIGIFCINTGVENSLEELSSILWDIDEDRGVMPVLYDNPSVDVGDCRFKLETGTVKIHQGSDSAGRYLWALDIPVVLKAWI